MQATFSNESPITDHIRSRNGQYRVIVPPFYQGKSIRSDWVKFEINRKAFAQLLLRKSSGNNDQVTTNGADDAIISIYIPISIKRRGVETRVILNTGTLPTPSYDKALIDLIARAQHYINALTDGTGKTEYKSPTTMAQPLPKSAVICPLPFWHHVSLKPFYLVNSRQT